MSIPRIQPEVRICPVDGTTFEVGGRGRPPRRQVYCSRHCMGIASISHFPVERGSHAPRPRKNHDTLHNEAWLRTRYLDERLNTTQIAADLGCSVPSVLHALRKFGIPVRSISEAKLGQPSNVVWTPEMRQSLAEKRRGSANPFHGKVSPHRGPNHHDDPRLARVRHMRASKYGLTGDAYDEMVAVQNGLCVICGRAEQKRHRSGASFTLSVDHCHKTGRVRALLCSRCNTALGMVDENADTLRAMIAYLERHAAEA